MKIKLQTLLFIGFTLQCSLLAQFSSLEKLQSAQDLIDKGHEFSNKQNLSEAISCYEKALAINENTFSKYEYHPGDGPDNPEAMRFFAAHEALQQLAFCYEQMGNDSKAKYYYKKGLASLPKPNSGPIDDMIVHYLMDLGNNEEALAIIEKNGGELLLYECDVLNALGDESHSKGDYKKGLFYYQKSLKIIEKEAVGPVTSICWGRIAETYKDSGDFVKAITTYKKCLEVDEQIIKAGINCPNAAVDLEDLGFCFTTINDYSKAIECYKKALTINEKILGDHDPVTVRVLQSLGKINYLNGDSNRAQEYLLKASASL